jgi:ubiquinone/menaquinone biosynthesis C-methylase UbiE
MSTITLKNKDKDSFLDEKNLTALQAKEKAQYIAFAPVIFKVALALRNFGILELIQDKRKEGIDFEDIANLISISRYGLRVLIDGGVQAGLIGVNDDNKYTITKTGYFILNDEMTTVNIDFINDVCYRGFDHLEASIKNGKPEGLKEFGNWTTIYMALSQLPPHVQKSWFAFDHFYSDDAFDNALPVVFKNNPKRITDIGGNTGKFALQCVQYNKDVSVTIVDLPGQLGIAHNNTASRSGSERIQFHEADMLNVASKLPEQQDIIWMSQFLDCFSENEIVAILKKCSEVMTDNTLVYIMEPLTDRQNFTASTFAVQMTSLYFTALANGNSRMYSSVEMQNMITEAGLEMLEIVGVLGICQSLIICRKQL